MLARVASQRLSDFFQRRHEAGGVRIILDAAVEAFEGTGGRATGVRLAGGRQIACDAVLVAIGATPNDALARSAGLTCADGIVVDAAARTSDPMIQAIGDCTRRSLPLYQRTGRLESVPNALEQAKQASASLCGRTPPAPEVPWFWSDQYRGPATDRRPAVRRVRKRRPRGSRDRIVRHLPSCRQRRRAGGRGGQCARRVHGRTNNDCQAKAGRTGQAARYVIITARTYCLVRPGSEGQNCRSSNLGYAAQLILYCSSPDHSAQAMTCPSSQMPRQTHSSPYLSRR